MGFYREIEGDLISLALQGEFDVIAHGVNCMCRMSAGIAPKMAKAFECDRFEMEAIWLKGDMDKLGLIDAASGYLDNGDIVMDFDGYFDNKEGLKEIYVVNAYTQYNYGKNHKDGVEVPLDYEALTLCMRKINHRFKGKHIGLPKIGCGLAGGDWSTVKQIIQKELKDCDVTIVLFKEK